MDSQDRFSSNQQARMMEIVGKGGCVFFIGLFIGIICHLAAIDLLFGPILVQIFPLPTMLSKWWVHLAGPGLIPFLMIIGGALITIFAIFQLYRAVFGAIVIGANLSRKRLLFAKIFFLTMIFLGFGPLFIFSVRLAWQSISFG